MCILLKFFWLVLCALLCYRAHQSTYFSYQAKFGKKRLITQFRSSKKLPGVYLHDEYD